MAHFTVLVLILPLLPSPSLSAGFSSHSHLVISLSNSISLPSSFLASSPPWFPISPVASGLVTFSSSTWLCRQENQTLSELRQGKANADRAWTLELLCIAGEEKEGGEPLGKSNAPRARGSAERPPHPAGTNCLLLMHINGHQNYVKKNALMIIKTAKLSGEFEKKGS